MRLVFSLKLTGVERLSVLTGRFPLSLRSSSFRQNCAASGSSVFRGIFGFLLVRAGFVPGKTKKGEKHRKGTLTDDWRSATVSLGHETASRKNSLMRSCFAARAAIKRYYSLTAITTPEPTVRPPSRIAKRRPFSIAIGVISSTSMSTLSPGMHISVPSGRVMTPVTSVVRK